MAFADDLNGLIDVVVADFESDMFRRGNVAWRSMAKKIRDMDADPSGRLIQSKFNRSTAAEISTELFDTVNSPAFNSSINKLIKTLRPISDLVQEHYENKIGEPVKLVIENQARNEIVITEQSINNDLRDADFNGEVVQPISARMFLHIQNMTPKADAIEDIKVRMQDRIKNFTTTRVSTIMQQFARNVNDIFGAALGSKRVRYVGPRDEINREFCAYQLGVQANRKSQSFTVEEVKQWSQTYTQEGGGWGGMIPNTNRSNIFENAGGYNCRHLFEYILPK